MKKILVPALAIMMQLAAAVSFAQQPNWQSCQQQWNPQQCMQGVHPSQQTSPSSLPMQPSFSQGTQIKPPMNSNPQIPTYQYQQPVNCQPNGFGGFRCQ